MKAYMNCDICGNDEFLIEFLDVGVVLLTSVPASC